MVAGPQLFQVCLWWTRPKIRAAGGIGASKPSCEAEVGVALGGSVAMLTVVGLVVGIGLDCISSAWVGMIGEDAASVGLGAVVGVDDSAVGELSARGMVSRLSAASLLASAGSTVGSRPPIGVGCRKARMKGATSRTRCCWLGRNTSRKISTPPTVPSSSARLRMMTPQNSKRGGLSSSWAS